MNVTDGAFKLLLPSATSVGRYSVGVAPYEFEDTPMSCSRVFQVIKNNGRVLEELEISTWGEGDPAGASLVDDDVSSVQFGVDLDKHEPVTNGVEVSDKDSLEVDGFEMQPPAPPQGRYHGDQVKGMSSDPTISMFVFWPSKTVGRYAGVDVESA